MRAAALTVWCCVPGVQEGSEPPAVETEQDWVESEATCQQLQEAGQYGMLIATEHMARLYLGWRPPTAVQVTVMHGAHSFCSGFVEGLA